MYLWFFFRFVVEVSRVFHQLTELWSCCMQVMHKRGSVNFRLDPYLGCFHFNLNWLSLCVYTIALVVVRFLWRKCLESLIYLLVIYLYFFVILKTKKIFVSRWMQAICYVKNTFIVVEVFTYLMTILWFPTCYLIFHWKDCKRSSPLHRLTPKCTHIVIPMTCGLEVLCSFLRPLCLLCRQLAWYFSSSFTWSVKKQ